ncbi:MAG: hypothetical protein ACKO1L_13805, partial [Brachymonas sp.]
RPLKTSWKKSVIRVVREIQISGREIRESYAKDAKKKIKNEKTAAGILVRILCGCFSRLSRNFCVFRVWLLDSENYFLADKGGNTEITF